MASPSPYYNPGRAPDSYGGGGYTPPSQSPSPYAGWGAPAGGYGAPKQDTSPFGNFFDDAKSTSVQKKLYLIDVSNATNISNQKNDD